MSLLSFYILQRFLVIFSVCLFTALCLIFMLDLLDLLRRTSDKPDVLLETLLLMGLLKLPRVGQQIIPLAILFSTMLTFWYLTRTQELIVIRTLGYSVWQFSLPILILALLFGVLRITVIQPLSTVFLDEYTRLERQYITHQKDLSLYILNAALWLRQSDTVHTYFFSIPKVSQQTPNAVQILKFSNTNQYLGRIDAPTIHLKNGFWLIPEGTLRVAQQPPLPLHNIRIPTQLTPKTLVDSHIRAENVSFWTLPHFIEILRHSGLSSLKHRLYYHQLLIIPLEYLTSVFLATVFSLRLPRLGRLAFLIICGIASGLGFFFFTQIISQLATIGLLPIPIAAWSPTLIVLLSSITLLLYQEDG